jgi:rhodanese-related sulfurtransferase
MFFIKVHFAPKTNYQYITKVNYMIRTILHAKSRQFRIDFSIIQRYTLFAVLVISVLLTSCTSAAVVETLPAPAENLPPNTWKEISVAEAAARYNEGAFMLDVRQPEEWDEIHIPGATLIPLGELPQRLGELPQDQEIVVYCRSGNRSQSGADILAKNGFEGVASMAGGINEWSSAGYPTESEK